MDKYMLRKTVALLVVIAPFVWMSLSANAKGIPLDFITSFWAWLAIGCAVAVGYLLYFNER